MCVSSGAPPHHKGQKVNDEVRSGANALWELLQDHNAVFIGDSNLGDDLEEFLEEHGISRKKSTSDKQEEYVKIIEKGMKSSACIVS